MTGKVGSCPASPAAKTPLRAAEEDPELIVLQEAKGASAGGAAGAGRISQLVLVVWSLATAVVAFSLWHSRAKVPLLSATFALTILSSLRE
jgi:hypothetical protein